ncbi:MAG: CheR family methyltransferase, partial [Bryobacteraceae bacterium]
LERVLIVGPGLDFAPRTSLDDRFPPQSYQPYAIADALIGLGLSAHPRIECVDINSRVIQFFQEFPRRSRPALHILSPPGDAEYLTYFRQLGDKIGAAHSEEPLEKTIELRREIARSVTADKLNIITERRRGRYDLAVATNVLVYFNDRELLLALANIQSMLAPGGYLIHNELRPVIDEYAQAVGLAAIQARTVRIAAGRKAPLYDGFAIYRK